jgi:solute carrier family 35, member F5
MIRVLCPHDESSYSMQLLLGYIGLVNGLSLMPVTIYLMFISSSSMTMANLTWIVFGYLVAKGMLDNVLSDYLWARAVILTSATVATVGLGLTIPLAFFSDWFMGHDVVNAQSICGALFVLIGFALVNIGFKGEERIEPSEDESVASHLDIALVIGTSEQL